MHADDDHHDSPSLTRRTVANGAIWTVPIIAMAVAAPAGAASRACPSVNDPSTWTTTYSRELPPGARPAFFNQYGGTYIPLSERNSESFLSVQDARPLAEGDATVTLETTFTPVAGTTYTFTFTARGTGGEARGQTLEILIGGAAVWSGASRAGLGPTTIIRAQANYSFTWRAPDSAPATLSYVFRMPATNGNNDDIRVALPLVSSTTCG
ncbi:MAG: hypothetical protein ACTIA6_02655 [Pseudoclavibacter sp.]